MTDQPQQQIPEGVRRIVHHAYATVKAFRELRRAGEEKAAEPARAKYRKQLQNALVELDQAVSAWAPERPTDGGFDWLGFFRTASKGIDFVRDLKDGKAGPKAAQEFVEAEVIDMKTRRKQ